MATEIDKKLILAFTMGVLATVVLVNLLQPNDLSREEAADIVVEKVYSDFGSDEYFVEVLSTKDAGDNLYKVEVALKKVASAETLSFFVTRDGKEIIRESEEAGQNSTVKEDAAPPTPTPAPSPALNAKGPEDAKVTIIEYSDFQCSFCKKFRDETLDAILEAYPDDVRFIFKNFPLESIHPAANSAAEAAECASEQGKYWEYHDILFSDSAWQQQRRAAYLGYAGELGLDVEAFTQCIDDGKYRSKVRNDLNEGVQLGVRGTPAFIINGKLVSGAQPFSAFQQEIDAVLSGAPTTPPPTTAPPQVVDVSVGDSAYLGPEDASVVIIEFSEFACPYCKRFHDDTLPQILDSYGDRVKFAFRHFIVHESARKAAEASECAHEQGRFFEYHDVLFEKAGLDVTSLKQYAAELGLDTAQFDGCLDSGKYTARVQKDMQDGRSAGVTGTPAFFINGKIVKGAQPFSTFQAEIEAALSAAG